MEAAQYWPAFHRPGRFHGNRRCLSFTHAIIPGFTLAMGFVLGGSFLASRCRGCNFCFTGLKSPKRVVTILEGESLVNDASSLIVFRVALATMKPAILCFGRRVSIFCGGEWALSLAWPLRMCCTLCTVFPHHAEHRYRAHIHFTLPDVHCRRTFSLFGCAGGSEWRVIPKLPGARAV
jgi:hypothetical protein